MKFESEKLQRLGNILRSNTKYDFGTVKVGRFSLTVTQNADIVPRIMDLVWTDSDWVFTRIKHVGNRFMVIDWDVLLNVKWARIWSR